VINKRYYMVAAKETFRVTAQVESELSPLLNQVVLVGERRGEKVACYTSGLEHMVKMGQFVEVDEVPEVEEVGCG